MQEAPRLRRNRSFAVLWISQTLSSLGTGAAAIAYPLLLLQLTHSVAIAGVASTAALVGNLVVQLPAGALADRFDRRLAMIVCDSVRACALLVLGLLVVFQTLAWPVVVAVAVVENAFAALFTTASMAALPAIVPKEQTKAAWAATEGRQYGASLVGPALGGFLFGLASAFPFLGDGLSYLISVVLLPWMRGRFRAAPRANQQRLYGDVVEGLRLVLGDPLLRGVVTCAPLLNFGINGMLFTVIVGLRVHGTAAFIVGFVQAAFALGGVFGALIAPRLGRRLNLWQLGFALTGAASVLIVLIAVLLPSVAVLAPLVLVPVLTPAANAAFVAAMFERTEEHLRGRVTSTLLLGISGMAAFAPLVGALLADQISFQGAMLAFAVVTALAAVPIWFLRRHLGLDRTPGGAA